MTDWKSAKNVLCIRLDAMGDLLMTTPALKMLKEGARGRKITLLTSPQGAKIAESIPLFHEIIVYEAPWLKASGLKKNPGPDFEMIRTLEEKRFDAAVIFSVYSQNPLPSAMMAYMAKIPLRAAYCRENPYSLLTTWIKEEEPEKILRHEVRRHLDLIEKLGCSAINLPLILNIDENARTSLFEKLLNLELGTDRKWVVIHPGSTAESRRYSIEGFARTADQLSENGFKVLFTGSAEERSLITEIQIGMTHPSFNLGGLLNLKEMIALLASSPLLISNNSGPVHMAAAVGTPVVVLYALTNPQHTPWLVPNHVLYHDVDCKFCYKSICPLGSNACLNNIDVNLIVEKSLDLLHTEEAPSYDFLAINPILINREMQYDYN